MLQLPRVTLAAIDGTAQPHATATALADAAAQAVFGRVILLSPTAPSAAWFAAGRAEWIEIPPLTLNEYNRFCLTRLHEYVSTSHCLTVQNDSRIVNPSSWQDEWLDYDYIGAPWPPGHSGTPHRVGNSGFCLRSSALLTATRELPNDTIVWRGERKPRCRDDVITCVMFRETLEREGLRFAPPDVAARFAFESPIPEAAELTTQFGVHEFRRKRTPS